jgi:hypothetical protein
MKLWVLVQLNWTTLYSSVLGVYLSHQEAIEGSKERKKDTQDEIDINVTSLRFQGKTFGQYRVRYTDVTDPRRHWCKEVSFANENQSLVENRAYDAIAMRECCPAYRVRESFVIVRIDRETVLSETVYDEKEGGNPPAQAR